MRRVSLFPVLVVFLITTAIFAPLLAAAHGLLGIEIPGVRLTQFATAVGAIIVLFIWRRALPLPPVARNRFLTPLLTTVGLGLAIVGIISAIAQRDGVVPPMPRGQADAVSVAVIAGYLIGALAEETGWRGLVQPLLEARLSPLMTAIVIGLMFGAGHFYMLASGVLVYAVFVVSAVGLSVTIAAVTSGRGWKQRILLATLLHSIVNIGLLVISQHHDIASLASVSIMAAATSFTALGCLPSLVKRSARSISKTETV